ncbi:MAG: hypothetical protein ACK4YT_00655 [Sphingomonas sp.]
MSGVPIGRLAASLAERANPDRRGPDSRVRRNSLDENDPAARPWEQNRFSTPTLRYATTDTLVEISRELQQEARAKFPRPVVRDLRDKQAALRGELADYAARAPGTVPVGAPATARIELERVDAALAEYEKAPTRTDVDVLEALLRMLKRTGEWIASWDDIAAEAACERKAVGRALEKWESIGVHARLRRPPVQTDKDLAITAQRKQIANAFKLTVGKLVGRLKHAFLQRRERRLKRMTKARQQPLVSQDETPLMPGVAELREAVTSLGASVARASP